MTISPETRRKNIWLLLALIAFAIGLTLTVLLWMRVKIRENGGVVDPTYSMQLDSRPYLALNHPVSFAASPLEAAFPG